MNTTTNFFEGLKLVKQIKQQKIFFRLYYDNEGNVLTYSMMELPHKYIVITPEEYAIADRHVIIKDGKIEKKNLYPIGKLVPLEETNDITLEITKWKMKHYE